MYRIGDQLFVQPDARLEGCFGVDEPTRMSWQGVAVARSHVEVFRNKDISVVFPLSPTRVLHMDWRHGEPDGGYDAVNPDAAPLNSCSGAMPLT
jgi:hypothetical protein